MTLFVIQSDKLQSNRIGVEVTSKDPIPNPYIRQKLVQKNNYLINTSKERGSKDGYEICLEILKNYQDDLDKVLENLESYLAQINIKLQESKYKKTIEDYQYFKNIRKAVQTIIGFTKEELR
jgi:capsule polysaccharide export protein KpsE/RkpR